MYRIPCHNCDCTYIGETGRNYGKRQEEHRKEVESISNRTFTRSDRKSRVAEMNKSAITDHVAKENRHKLVRCQNFGKRRTSENQAGQGIDLDSERTHLHEQRWRGVKMLLHYYCSWLLNQKYYVITRIMGPIFETS